MVNVSSTFLAAVVRRALFILFMNRNFAGTSKTHRLVAFAKKMVYTSNQVYHETKQSKKTIHYMKTLNLEAEVTYHLICVTSLTISPSAGTRKYAGRRTSPRRYHGRSSLYRERVDHSIPFPSRLTARWDVRGHRTHLALLPSPDLCAPDMAESRERDHVAKDRRAGTVPTSTVPPTAKPVYG